MMRVNDILHSCSHDHVAEAAVVSIGGAFASGVKSSAAARGQTVGEFASQHVIRFSREASERDWRIVADRMQKADLALLAGLEALMTRMMGGDVRPQAGASGRSRAAA